MRYINSRFTYLLTYLIINTWLCWEPLNIQNTENFIYFSKLKIDLGFPGLSKPYLSSFLSCCFAKSRSFTRRRSSSMHRFLSTAPKLIRFNVSNRRTSFISRSSGLSVWKLGEWFTWRTYNTIDFRSKVDHPHWRRGVMVNGVGLGPVARTHSDWRDGALQMSMQRFAPAGALHWKQNGDKQR